MYAVEFESKIDNGVVIIPQKYQRVMQSENAKIIIMVELSEEIPIYSKKSRFDAFLRHSKEVDSLEIYSREELHER